MKLLRRAHTFATSNRSRRVAQRPPCRHRSRHVVLYTPSLHPKVFGSELRRTSLRVADGPRGHAARNARDEQRAAALPAPSKVSPLDCRPGSGYLPRSRRNVPKGRLAKVGAKLLLWHRLALRDSSAGRVRTLPRDVRAKAGSRLRCDDCL